MNLNAARRLRRCTPGFLWPDGGHGGSRTLILFLMRDREAPVCMSFDSFPDYRLGNQAQEVNL